MTFQEPPFPRRQPNSRPLHDENASTEHRHIRRDQPPETEQRRSRRDQPPETEQRRSHFDQPDEPTRKASRFDRFRGALSGPPAPRDHGEIEYGGSEEQQEYDEFLDLWEQIPTQSDFDTLRTSAIPAVDATHPVIIRPWEQSRVYPIVKRPLTLSRQVSIVVSLVIVVIVVILNTKSFDPALASGLPVWSANRGQFNLGSAGIVPSGNNPSTGNNGAGNNGTGGGNNGGNFGTPPLSTSTLPIPGPQGLPTQSNAPQGGTVSVAVDPNNDQGPVNPMIWGINAPDRNLRWAGNTNIVNELKAARIPLIRIGPIQYSNVVFGHPMCSSPTNCDFSLMDQSLRDVFQAGAQPEFQLTDYPGGVAANDWQAYATFMRMVITRYNVNLVLGQKIKYWEFWNEPTVEPDGTLTEGQYVNMIVTVGGAMKAIDPSIRIVAPASAWPDLGPGGWLDYMAKNTGNIIDVLSFHSYGDYGGSDQARLDSIKADYYDEIVNNASRFVTPSGKQLALAVTEYNIAWKDLSSGSTYEWHSSYDAVYAADTILWATKAHADHFTYFTVAQAGKNLLGILDPSNNYAPFRPYYTFAMYGNYMRDRLINATSSDGTVDTLASKSNDGTLITIMIISKDMQNRRPIAINVAGLGNGTATIAMLSDNSLPTTQSQQAYQNGTLTVTVDPLSVTAVMIKTTP